jgi:hypothetical protein
MAMDAIAKCQEAHSTEQGGVKSIRVVMRHSRAFKTCMPNKQSLLLISRSGKSLRQAYWAKKECTRNRNGSRIGLNDHSVVFPTRVLANSQGHTNAIDALNSLCDQAQVLLRIQRLMQYCLAKTRRPCGANQNDSDPRIEQASTAQVQQMTSP